MSDTPRTDAFISCSPMFGKNETQEVVNFARQLERELTEERKKIKEQLEMEDFRTQSFNRLAGTKIEKLGDIVDAWKKLQECLLNNSYGINAVGELLRNIFFNQSKGFGCYENFELNPWVKPLPHEENKEGNMIYTCAEWNGIKMRYFWDGDGFLEFLLDNEGRAIYNDDCKKQDWKYDC